MLNPTRCFPSSQNEDMHERYSIPDRYTWTASLGRWLGVPLRLHVFFVLFGIVVLLVEWHSIPSESNHSGTGIATVIVLLISVLIHELAHVFANINLGGQSEDITLAPWGGQSRLYLPENSRHQFWVYIAGPCANAAIFGVGAILLIQSRNAELSQLVNPFQPVFLNHLSPETSVLRIITWVNFQLLVVNLLPVHPLDASHALRALIKSHNPLLCRVRTETVLLVVGIGTSLIVIGLAWIFRNQGIGLFPGWFIFSMAGIALISTARYGFHVYTLPELDHWEIDEYEEFDRIYDDEDLLNFEAEEGDELSISQWLQEKQESREALERSVEIEEERRADHILEKLHHDGFESLTDEEKSLLNRVSARYRRRRQLRS